MSKYVNIKTYLCGNTSYICNYFLKKNWTCDLLSQLKRYSIATLHTNSRWNLKLLVAKVNGLLALFRQELCNQRGKSSGYIENRQVKQN